MTSNVKIPKTTTFRITDLAGDCTGGFFDNDWHANGLFTKVGKFATKTGAVKITANITPSLENGMIPFSKLATEAQIDGTLEGNAVQIKMKPKALVAHFGLGEKSITPETSVRSYVSLNIPNNFKDVNKETTTTFGGILHNVNS